MGDKPTAFLAAGDSHELVLDNKRVLKVIPIKSDKDARGMSRALPDDLFKEDYLTDTISPPFDMLTLSLLPESSSILGPCIDAMRINISGMGHRIVPRDDSQLDYDKLQSDVKRDITIVKNFFNNASLDGTWAQTRNKARHDVETTGNGYYEVLMKLYDQDVPAGLNHLPSWTMRLTKADSYPTPCEVPRALKNEDTNKWEIVKFPYKKYFRRFVMRRDMGVNKTYFKEWGDPRVVDCTSGEVLAQSWDLATDQQKAMAANPVIHLKLYCPRSPYGLPRHVGTFFRIYGSRAAEVINYTTLKCNNIPALIMMATNVMLTKGSLDRIKEFVEERVQGDNNYSTILIVEGEPISEGMKDPGSMKLELKPLSQDQHTDAMFVNYMKENESAVRQAFRLPPIYVGSTVEYNRSTSESSKRLAEEQVFAPERSTEDDIYNITLVPALGVASAIFRSNTPNVSDNYELTQLLAVAERSGGLSPRISRMVVESVLGKDLPDVDTSINPDVPFSLTVLREQLKAQYTTQENQSAPEVASKSLSDREIITQLRMLKSMMIDQDHIPEVAKRSVDTMLMAMEYGIGEITDREVFLATPNHDKTTHKKLVRPIFKKDEEHIIGGAVLVPGVVDLQGDTYDADAVEFAANWWLEHYLEDPKENGIKLMHEGEVIFDAARPIQSYVLMKDMEFKVDVPVVSKEHTSKDFTKLSYPKGTWMLYARVRDMALWDRIKSGDFIGWSIGGEALVQAIKSWRMSNR